MQFWFILQVEKSTVDTSLTNLQEQWSLRHANATMDAYRENPDAYAEWEESLTDETAAELLKDWWFMARDEQLPPVGDWAYWMYLAGRGAGKTRTGAEWTRDQIKQGFNRGGLIAPTAADARDVMIEGESGLLACCSKNDYRYDGVFLGKPVYEPSKRRVTWENGQMVTLFSADEPERLRGPQHEFIWADEIVAWRRPETWDLALFGLRLGTSPRAFISTTPKPKKMILDLMEDTSTVLTRGSTYSNRSNLAKQFFQKIVTKFEGTRLGQQELMGVVLKEAEGALWTRKMIDQTRVMGLPNSNDFFFVRIVVGVDPAITAKQESDENGIVVVGLGSDGHSYVLADYSLTALPGKWASEAVRAASTWQADAIVAEGNQGGEMVRHTIAGALSEWNLKNPHKKQHPPVQVVHASRGKQARAEPISALHEQGKVHFVGAHMQDLEDQLCTWEPLSGDKSPDRLDAFVWAVTACALGNGIMDASILKGFY